MLSLKAELLSEIRRLDTRIDAVNTRFDAVDSRFDAVDVRLDSLDREVRVAIDIRERLAALEARRPA